MTNLRRRLRKLEALLTDNLGLVPSSQAWLDYWTQRMDRIITGEEPGTPGCIPLEAFDAIVVRDIPASKLSHPPVSQLPLM